MDILLTPLDTFSTNESEISGKQKTVERDSTLPHDPDSKPIDKTLFSNHTHFAQIRFEPYLFILAHCLFYKINDLANRYTKDTSTARIKCFFPNSIPLRNIREVF